MFIRLSGMRAWIGKYIAAVGIVHTILGLVLFRGIFAQFAFWLVAIGLFWILLGAVVDNIEREGRPLPGFLGWALAAITVFGATINPMSGWWLFFIPAAALLYR